LAPAAVRPVVQSQGIGSHSIREGLCLCQELEYNYSIVLGNPKYYQRFGFERSSKRDLQNEYGVDDEFMVIRFSDQGMSDKEMAHGLVRYALNSLSFSYKKIDAE
jgi:predicted N-acetyltransferase YhbS